VGWRSSSLPSAFKFAVRCIYSEFELGSDEALDLVNGFEIVGDHFMIGQFLWGNVLQPVDELKHRQRIDGSAS